jgi:hypothetical protein
MGEGAQKMWRHSWMTHDHITLASMGVGTYLEKGEEIKKKFLNNAFEFVYFLDKKEYCSHLTSSSASPAWHVGRGRLILSTGFTGVDVVAVVDIADGDDESGCQRRSQLEVDEMDKGTTESEQPPLAEDELPRRPLKDICNKKTNFVLSLKSLSISFVICKVFI